MKNQFFYTRTEKVEGSEELTSFKDSFNITKVIRSLTMTDGRTLVLLDDLHERSQDVPDIDTKTNKMKGIKRQRDTFQTEIYLDAADALRFEQLTSL